MSDIETIKKIRDMTGLSVGQIKKALEESDGNEAKAIEILKAHGATVAAKKGSRTTSQGVVESYVHTNRKIAATVALLCETDFVARNPVFLELAHEIAMHITAMEPKDTDELLSQPYIKDQNISIKDLINGAIAKLGENIKVGEFSRIQI